MEPGGSLPHSQEPATCPYPEPAQSSPCPIFLKIYFNIILPSTPGSPKWSPSLRSPHQNPVCIVVSPAFLKRVFVFLFTTAHRFFCRSPIIQDVIN
jgi:hypothetical protein